MVIFYCSPRCLMPCPCLLSWLTLSITQGLPWSILREDWLNQWVTRDNTKQECQGRPGGIRDTLWGRSASWRGIRGFGGRGWLIQQVGDIRPTAVSELESRASGPATERRWRSFELGWRHGHGSRAPETTADQAGPRREEGRREEGGDC